MSNRTNTVQVQAVTLRKVLRLLDGLNVSDTGQVLYRQVSRMLNDYESVTQETEQTLIASVGFLLDAISTHLASDSKLLTKISLLRTRLSPPIDYVELYALRRALEECADSITLSDDINEQQVRKLVTPLLLAYGLTDDELAKEIMPIKGKPGQFGAKVHYLQTTEALNELNTKNNKDKDGSISKGMGILMESLTAHEKVQEGLDKFNEFGKFIEVELGTIKHIDELAEFNEKKSVFLSELQTILHNHNQLTEYFEAVSSYLSLIQNEGQRLNEELSRMTTLSLTDELTGLPNRRAFLKRMRDEISRAQRYGNSLALAIIDLDGFKNINDSYGHPAGDAVLRSYSEDVLTTFRQNDMVARYGGEEFAVVFPNTAIDGAYKALQKVLKRANETHLQYDNVSINLPSFSAGLVVFKPGESLESLVGRADDSLYQAKKTGRNRIHMIKQDSIMIE